MLVCTQLYNLLASAFSVHLFKQCYKYKSISTINPAIVENTECLIVKVCAPVITNCHLRGIGERNGA